MELPQPMFAGRLLRRYKRFLADVVLEDGTTTTVHCPNTGAMHGCANPGSRVWLSQADNPRRKYPLTWELVEAEDGVLVGIHSARANQIVREALEAGRLCGLGRPAAVRTEARLPDQLPDGRAARVDLVALAPRDERDCYIEVKSVTAVDGPGAAFFPDAVSRRAARHLEVLAGLARAGRRGMMVFCVQRPDVERLRAAAEIDPEYAGALARAFRAGVECLAYRCRVTPARIELDQPVKLDPVMV